MKIEDFLKQKLFSSLEENNKLKEKVKELEDKVKHLEEKDKPSELW